MRKIIISLIIVLLVTIIALAGWYFFSRNPNTPVAEIVLDILPFGSGGGDTTRPTTDNSQPTTEGEGQGTSDEFGKPSANLFRISQEPVAGMVVINKNASTTIVRYVDRATGHIYDADLATLAKTKVSNQTLPKVYEAYFKLDGNAVLLRFLKDDTDTVENFSLTLTPPQSASSTLYTVSSTALRGDISTVAVGSGNTLFYALRDTSSVVSSTFNGTGAKTLLTSPFTNWNLVATGNNLIMYTKASANVLGYAYTLNTTNGALAKILGPLNGLVVTPNTSGNRVLYSYTDNNGAKLFAKNLINKTFSEISPATLAEKCVWSAKNASNVFCGAPVTDLETREPDSWYRGLTHFSDRIWLFETDTNVTQILVEPKQTLDIDIDVMEPKLSPNEDYLIFINKRDLSLWALKLE